MAALYKKYGIVSAKFDVPSDLMRRFDTLNHCGRLFVNSDAVHFLSAVHLHYNTSADLI